MAYTMIVSVHVLKLSLSFSFSFAVAYAFECFNCLIATEEVGGDGSHVTMAQTFNPLLFKSTQSQFTQHIVSIL